MFWRCVVVEGPFVLIVFARLSKQNAQNAQNTINNTTSSAPSGIAQLRKSSDQTPANAANAEHPDAMNLDDFIFSDNISTPAGLGQSPSPELSKKETSEKSSNAVASAIPIKMRKESSQFAVPQSVPVPHHNPRSTEEFNYVQRHVRKTSIDERRVSYYFFRRYYDCFLSMRHLR
jgi:GATA-binding protein